MGFMTHYNISINATGINGTSAKYNYTTDVTKALDKIVSTTTGKILLDSIRFHGKPIEITPFLGVGCNAEGGGTTIGGVPQSGFVNFTPGVFRPHSGTCAAEHRSGGRGLLPDEVLFHELFHTFRVVSGKWNRFRLPGQLVHFKDSEEFLAVMVSNIYVSDRTNKRKSGLRAAHVGFRALGNAFTEPYGFFTRGFQVFRLVKQLYEDNYGLFIRIANDVSNAQFNPLTDFVANRKYAEAMSRTALTPKGLVDVMNEMNRI